ncbi:MAG: RodZ domain-containing protein [Rectinemataceae bacterium]|jgi:cytoskeletal protein RodZ
MTPIGEQLRTARERKGLTLERVADDTNIAKRYLTGLETEDFTVFPGDPYVIGFLRNYAEYLGLPSDELVAAYKNMKIQEQPVPIQELIPRRGPSPFVIGATIVGAAILMIIVLVAVFGRRGHAGAEASTSRHSAVEYRVEGSAFEKRLYVGDSLLVAYGNEKYKLVISRIDDAVTLETPVGATRLMLGEEGTIDLDRNNQPELKVLVSDLSKKDPSKGAILRLEYSSPDAALKASAQTPIPAADLSDQASASPAASATAAPTAPTPAAGALSAPSGKNVVLFESGKTPYPFVVSVTFRGSCMFRYEVDKRDRDERYYRKGETVTVNANNSLRLWASNAQTVKMTVQASGGKSADLEIGGAGEVAVKRIAWTQGDSGTWILGASDVD